MAPNLAQIIETEFLLGSTEGTYYYTSTGALVDKRYTAVQITGSATSGLSFGLTQLDVGNNPQATDLFETALTDAVKAKRITQAQANDFLERASTKGIATKPNRFTTAELNTITNEVLAYVKPQINALDQSTITIVAAYAANLINSVKPNGVPWVSLIPAIRNICLPSAILSHGSTALPARRLR
jgi:hypothetical protein